MTAKSSPSLIDVCRGEEPTVGQQDHQWVAEPEEQDEQQLVAFADVACQSCSTLSGSPFE